MTEKTDHDLLICVVNDVSHVRDDIAQMTASFQSYAKATDKQREADERRIRELENKQVKLFTRWRFFGWAVGGVTALGGLIGLIRLLA